MTDKYPFNTPKPPSESEAFTLLEKYCNSLLEFHDDKASLSSSGTQTFYTAMSIIAGRLIRAEVPSEEHSNQIAHCATIIMANCFEDDITEDNIHEVFKAILNNIH